MLWQTKAESNFRQKIYPITECNDGIDNDGDGGIDFASDPECTSWQDDSEEELIDPPDPEPEPGPDSQPTVNPRPRSNNNREEDLSEEEESILIDDFGDVLSAVIFPWSPIAEVVSEEVLPQEGIAGIGRDYILYCCGLLYILLLAILGILLFVKPKEKEEKDERANN